MLIVLYILIIRSPGCLEVRLFLFVVVVVVVVVVCLLAGRLNVVYYKLAGLDWILLYHLPFSTYMSPL